MVTKKEEGENKEQIKKKKPRASSGNSQKCNLQ